MTPALEQKMISALAAIGTTQDARGLALLALDAIPELRWAYNEKAGIVAAWSEINDRWCLMFFMPHYAKYWRFMGMVESIYVKSEDGYTNKGVYTEVTRADLQQEEVQ
jgi:hypothetical protein